MARAKRPKAVFAALAVIVVSVACNRLPIVGGEPLPTASATLASPSPARTASDGDGPYLYTDPPLPTYLKTTQATMNNVEWELPDCLDSFVEVDVYPGIAPLVRTSSIVVVAMFDDYGDPRWNTTSGDRPTTIEYLESGYPVTIVRDLRLTTVEFLRGDPSDMSGAYVRGGELGCDSIVYSNMPEMATGYRAVFFGSLPTAGAQELPQLLRVWPIDDSNVVTTDSGAIELAELRDLVENTPYDPTDPFGTSQDSPEPTTAPQ